MKVFNVTVECVISVFAEDEGDAVGKVGEMISSRADFGGQLRAIHAANPRESAGYQPIADGSGRVPPGDE